MAGDKREPHLPEVPTAAEAGVTGFYSTSWAGLGAKGHTAGDHRQTQHGGSQSAGHTRNQGAVPRSGRVALSSTPQEFARFIRADYERVAKVAKLAGLRVD